MQSRHILSSSHSKVISKSYYMYGKHAVLAALINKNRLVNIVKCTASILAQYQHIIEKYKFEIVQNKNLDNMVGDKAIHQGIIAEVKTIFSSDINKILTSERVVILDQVVDPQNIGSIIRSAAAFNVDALIMSESHSPEESAALAKAASGALELVNIVRVSNLKRAIDLLKNSGFWLIGLDGSAHDTLNNKIMSPKMAVVLGSEGKGLRHLTKESCDFLIKIPINDNVESLNVSNVAAIIFHQISLNGK